ncbi:hypothetical protein CRM22_003690 [Opisthorchis felineus]|uniref:ADF-H domain-containing protein n=1 Tax=Opisthorchis felineus TaxID=147828 RepID=A0A4S2M670_OPIFE|nr:hypothetical protein CRM22_003690 [Opisthorchis felineus]
MSKPEVAAVSSEASETLQKFKFRKSKTHDVLILKIDRKSLLIEQENFVEDIPLDNLVDELPSHEPRYVLVIYRYEKELGRVVYPYCMVFSTPEGCPPMLKMLYTASLPSVVEKSGVGKVFELRDVEDFSEAWLREQLENER